MAESMVKKAKGAPIKKIGHTGAKNQGRDESARNILPDAYEQSK